LDWDEINLVSITKLYGFGQRTGVDLPGETSGLIHTKEELNPVELATSSFGQTQTVTMVQMLSGFSSLINGGNYYQPHLVKEIQNSNGDVVKTIGKIKKATREELKRNHALVWLRSDAFRIIF